MDSGATRRVERPRDESRSPTREAKRDRSDGAAIGRIEVNGKRWRERRSVRSTRGKQMAKNFHPPPHPPPLPSRSLVCIDTGGWPCFLDARQRGRVEFSGAKKEEPKEGGAAK